MREKRLNLYATEPQRYIYDDGYFFHVQFETKLTQQPLDPLLEISIKCHMEEGLTKEQAAAVVKEAKSSFVKRMIKLRDELNSMDLEKIK